VKPPPVPCPSKSPPELREQILNLLTKGKPNRRICRSPGMPSSETVRCWRRADPEFARQFDIARQCGVTDDLFVRVEEACAQGDVALAKLIFDNGRWLLARQVPRFFDGGK
jgi:hypothetical protein